MGNLDLDLECIVHSSLALLWIFGYFFIQFVEQLSAEREREGDLKGSFLVRSSSILQLATATTTKQVRVDVGVGKYVSIINIQHSTVLTTLRNLCEIEVGYILLTCEPLLNFWQSYDLTIKLKFHHLVKLVWHILLTKSFADIFLLIFLSKNLSKNFSTIFASFIVHCAKIGPMVS